ncbi:MBL fold metallo-hydrolase [Flavihumibacter profundi]|uniref:MBL fold metallo-hydrolase n=1 Tax=Flavihumibacter profundi TaxID=2716883 RepID=UPI001CC6CDEF|nr:MBL fold metallo-hydrolase [Flavihumibacter profundi]MBZ5855862.1 MBL fold metallo-hydrolase [Flavihumibacter profundi]
MDKIKNSPNFRNGAFQNLSTTPMMAEGVSTFKILRDFLNKPKSVNPPGPLPSVQTNLKELSSDKPTVIWFGHSSYLININGINVLVDPVFSGSAAPISSLVKAFPGSNEYGPKDMPATIDYMVLTHNHYDHLDKKTMVELNQRTKQYIVPLGVAANLKNWSIGKERIIEMDWWESNQLSPYISITSTPARHFSGRGFKRGGSLWTSYLLNIFGFTIYIGGDSGYDLHFAEIGKAAGEIDLAILECGQYNAYWPYIHMQPEEVVQAYIDLGAKMLLPVHWGKFALAYHAWNEPIIRVTTKAAEKGVPIATPRIGEPLVINGSNPSKAWWLDIAG